MPSIESSLDLITFSSLVALNRFQQVSYNVTSQSPPLHPSIFFQCKRRHIPRLSYALVLSTTTYIQIQIQSIHPYKSPISQQHPPHSKKTIALSDRTAPFRGCIFNTFLLLLPSRVHYHNTIEKSILSIYLSIYYQPRRSPLHLREILRPPSIPLEPLTTHTLQPLLPPHPPTQTKQPGQSPPIRGVSPDPHMLRG